MTLTASGHGAFLRALRAEWTKFRTTAGPGWLLVAVIVLTTALSALAAGAVACPDAACRQDLPKVGLTGVVIGQAVVAVLAVLVMGGEYTTGMIRTTLAANPRRWMVLAAKAVVLSGLVLLAGTVAVLGSVLVTNLILSGNGYPTISLADGPTLRAAVGSVLYFVLMALLGVGIATAVRDPAVSIGAVLALLYLFPILAALVTDPDWQRHLKQTGPMNAGLAIQNTVDLDSLPIGPWPGLGVLGLWALCSLAGGFAVFQVRDA